MSKLYQKINGSAVPLSGGVGVINNLNSTSITDALSANMGKVLNDKVSSVPKLLKPATAINTGDDLNDYMELGEYYCDTSVKTASLSNCPLTQYGFKLTVEKLYSEEPTQTIEAYSGIIYKRTYSSSISSWLSWRHIVLEENYEVTDLTSQFIAGNIGTTQFIKVYRTGLMKILALRIYGITTDSDTWQTIVTLPETLRPLSSPYFQGCFPSYISPSDKSCQCRISQSNGNVDVSYVSANANYYILIPYI